MVKIVEPTNKLKEVRRNIGILSEDLFEVSQQLSDVLSDCNFFDSDIKEEIVESMLDLSKRIQEYDRDVLKPLDDIVTEYESA